MPSKAGLGFPEEEAGPGRPGWTQARLCPGEALRPLSYEPLGSASEARRGKKVFEMSAVSEHLRSETEGPPPGVPGPPACPHRVLSRAARKPLA